ncbi:MAG: RNA polymerase sporulation sigma factor SigK [Oscillospiraceae bacterium]|nr:RNA polymerase sporulation sigma factor SigK [Oscillospiraceae bacterium]
MFGAILELLLGNLLYFALHLEKTGSFPKPLSAKEERECFERAAEGDKAARNRLIEHNLRLVAHVVKKYNVPPQQQEDLVSVGTIGLIKAVSSFDFRRGARFATFAARCIENEILMYFRSAKRSARDIYINDPIESDGEDSSLTLMDLIADDRDMTEEVELRINAETLAGQMERVLSEREKTVLILRYGLGGRAPMTQKETAKLLGISRSYVSRIEKGAILTLRDAMKK